MYHLSAAVGTDTSLAVATEGGLHLTIRQQALPCARFSMLTVRAHIKIRQARHRCRRLRFGRPSPSTACSFLANAMILRNTGSSL